MKVPNRLLLLFEIRGSGLRGVQNEGKNSVQISGPPIHGANVAIHGEFAGAKANRHLWSGQQDVGESGDSLFLRIRRPLAVIERKVIARGFRVEVNVFEQAGANVKLIGRPCRLRSLFVLAELGNGPLRRLKFRFLLVVIEHASGGIQVFRIPSQRGARLIKKIAEVAGLAKQIEVALDQFGIPKRLEASLVDGQPLVDRRAPVFQHGPSFDGEDLIGGELLLIVGDHLAGKGELFLGYEKCEKSRVERRLERIASNPRLILSDRIILRKSLLLYDAEDALEGPPGALLIDRSQFLRG